MSEVLSPAKQVDRLEIIANRYRVEQLLGRGGMGIVYKVYDTSNNRHVALKYLCTREDPEAQQTSLELFEREYHTLSHLSHPRVVAVYDYGKEGEEPYYTMELLEGGDLNELSPLPWATVCALLCDVCSVLSLLHSRRLVHRDLTPRNIRCTRDQQAKLIDFGAMIPFGLEKYLVGTPQFIAPEAYLGQVVDGRADLFSLGATAYYALTRQHAYPAARTLSTMRDAWRSRPVPPSRYTAELPPELDQLVMSLVNLDPMARPASAAEVMERLSGIAGVRIDEQLVVRQAYLSSPALVGRDDIVLRARKQIVRALRGRGGTMVITGAAGVGRSRLLNAYALEGKLAGATVLRADAEDANAGPWGGARALARQLIAEIPEISLRAADEYAPVLGHIIPEIFDQLTAAKNAAAQEGQRPAEAQSIRVSGGTAVKFYDRRPSSRPAPRPGSTAALKVFDTPQHLRVSLHTALRDWLVEISERRCVVVAVDDIHRLDEPSAAFVALLSQFVFNNRLVAVVTAESGAAATSERALELLMGAGGRIKLKNLSLEETEKLLSSIFGEAPNVRLVADRLQAISDGNPSVVMQLARHLLDKGLVSYQGGAWTLPTSIDASDLPQTLNDALKARLQNVSTNALELAQTIALSSKRSFDFGDCLALTAHQDKAQLISDLNELVALEILATDGDFYALRHASWRSVLSGSIAKERAIDFHLRLAELLEKRGTEPFSPANHLLLANQAERALDLFLERADAIYPLIQENSAMFLEYIQSLPLDWIDILESLIQVGRRLNCSHAQQFSLTKHLVTYASIAGEVRPVHLKELLAQLYHDSGLDIYHELGDSVEPPARLERALTLAQERFDATPESERVLSAFEAISKLAQVIVQSIGVLLNASDFESFKLIPSLEPLLPLSPALGVVQKNLESTLHTLAGRNRMARRLWIELIDRIDREDHAGLDESTYTYARLAMIYGVGVIDVMDGLMLSTQWIDELEQNPLFEVNAWRLRMLQALGQGETDQAEACKKRIEILQIQNSPTQVFEGTLLWYELLIFAACEDLVQIRRTVSVLERMAERHPGWQRCVHFGRGTYHRCRGDMASAKSEFELALSLTRPGKYASWAPIVGGHLLALLSLGRASDARKLAERAMEVAQEIKLGTYIRYIQQPLALVEAFLKEYDSAVAHADAIIESLRALGASGVVLGSAYETRARVAIAMQDRASFDRYGRLCASQYRVRQNSALTAKYEKLMHDARRAGVVATSYMVDATDPNEQVKRLASTIATMLSICQGPQQRAERVLDIVLKKSGSNSGLLYTLQKPGPMLAAQAGDPQPPERIDALVADFLSAELEDICEVTVTEADVADRTEAAMGWKGPNGNRFIPCLLAHQSDAGYTITAVVVMREDPGEKLETPHELLPILSKSLFDAGDVVTAIAAS